MEGLLIDIGLIDDNVLSYTKSTPTISSWLKTLTHKEDYESARRILHGLHSHT